MELKKEQLLKMYEQMLLLRRFEERAAQLYSTGTIAGFCHLYIGQEAVAVGIHNASQKQDTFITGYRCHGHTILAGSDPKAVMAELTGRSGGVSKGKGGSMHMFNPEGGFYGGHGIVGAWVSIGTGLAFAHKYKKDNGICSIYYGDGSANQGQVAECFNMAALWNLPALYVVENNHYAMGTSILRGASGEDFYRRGEPWGIAGKRVDGMNVVAVYEAAYEAMEYIRAGNGPYILELDTYRYRGHSMSDPGKYRTRDEIENVRNKRDPIENLKRNMIQNGVAREEELDALEDKVKSIVLEAAEFARSCPEPNSSELYTNIML